MALANRIASLRAEVVHFIEESRAIEIEAIETAMKRQKASRLIAPTALAIIASSVGLSLSRERQLGVSSGHDAMLALVDVVLKELDE
jgi:hypothetical protein